MYLIFTQQSNNWSSRMDTNTDAKGGNKTDAQGGEDAQALHQEAGRQRPTDRRLSFGFPAGSSTPAQQQAAAELSNALAATELMVNKSKAQTGGLDVLDEEGYMEKAWDLDQAMARTIFPVTEEETRATTRETGWMIWLEKHRWTTQ